MNEFQVIEILSKNFKFTDFQIKKLKEFVKLLLVFNKRYNLISKNTENSVWHRHILDSAQIINFFDKKNISIADFGSGAGFPGVILAIYGGNHAFHVKLYEKSPVKRIFLEKARKTLGLKYDIYKNVYDNVIDADIVVARAFKKLEEIIQISREKMVKKHKILILKGKNAQTEINNVSLESNYSYKLFDSITDVNSKVVLLNVKKNG
tara:strand:+ start:1942 stop:2562 length:621 start_codon:yes stop_codon:yes gene_type:complete